MDGMVLNAKSAMLQPKKQQRAWPLLFLFIVVLSISNVFHLRPATYLYKDGMIRRATERSSEYQSLLRPGNNVTMVDVANRRDAPERKQERSSEISSDHVPVNSTDFRCKGLNESDLLLQGKTQTKRVITMIIELKGRMGNHLSFMARAYAIKTSMERKFNSQHKQMSLEINLVGQHQKKPDLWHRAAKEVRKCFPKAFANFEFESGIWKKEEFPQRQRQQNKWLKTISEGKYALHVDPYNCNEGYECWHGAYCQLESMLLQQQQEPDNLNIQEPEGATISLPYLTSDKMQYHQAVDEYYDEIRDLFWMNEAACCGKSARPNRNESVLHVRNFGESLRSKGFHEMEPEQVANHLLQQLKHNDHLSIVSKDAADNYENAVQTAHEGKIGLTIRQVHGKTGMEDFCYLKRTSKELIGMKTSSYFSWAAILSDANHVRMYSMNNTWSQGFHYHWKQPSLRERLQFEIYNVQSG